MSCSTSAVVASPLSVAMSWGKPPNKQGGLSVAGEMIRARKGKKENEDEDVLNAIASNFQNSANIQVRV